MGEDFMRLSAGNVSEFQRKKASGVLHTEFSTIDEKDDVHRIMTEMEPLLGASGYRARRKILSILVTAWRRRYGTPNEGIWC